MKIATIFLLLMCCCALRLFSQEATYTNFEKFTTQDGLPQNHINRIDQDRDGFVWIATPSGLTRFDGKTFITFGADKEAPYTLSSSNIRDILIDEDNKLWVIHLNNSVDVMNPETFTSNLAIKPIATLFKDEFSLKVRRGFSTWIFGNNSSGQWFIENGSEYLLYDASYPQLVKLFQIKYEKDALYGFGINPSDGSLWTLEKDGVVHYDSSWTSAKRYDLPLNMAEKYQELGYAPLVNLDSNRVLFTGIRELFVFDELDQRLQTLKLPDVPYLWHKGIVVPLGLNKTTNGNFVFAYQGYVYQLNPQTLEIKKLWESPQGDLLPISSLLLTETNTLWVGVSGGGLYKVDLLSPGFNSYRYNENFLADLLKKEVEMDLSSFPKNWTAQSFPYGLRTFSRGNEVLVTNEIGFGSERHAYVLKDNNLSPLPIPPLEHESCFMGIASVGNSIWTIDRDGWLFEWENPYAFSKMNHVIPINNEEEMENASIVDLAVDERNQWIITKTAKLFQIREGELINTYHPGSGKSSFVSLKQDPIEDSILWIGSIGDGLIRWNKETRSTSYRFAKKDGLVDDKVAGMVFDRNNDLWLSTFNGISRYKRSSKTFNNYTSSDGLQETEFNRHHNFLLPDGSISFGGPLSYVVFDPLLFKEDEYNPRTNISSMFLNGKNVLLSKDSSYLKNPINTITQLNLPYDKNSLSFELASNAYNNIEKTNYRYCVSNYSNGWVNLGDQNTVRLDQLPPGGYTLKFNVSNSQGRWSSFYKEIELKIHPPPWLSWWAYLFYFSLIVLLVYIYWKNYKRKLIRKQEEEFNRREAKRLLEMDQMKTRFFSNITHEFRTPLTLILSPIEKYLQSEELTEKARKMLKSNYENASQLLGLVNQLLDISKIESGNMQSFKAKGELINFIQNIIDRFSESAKQKDIALHFIHENAEGTYEFDKLNLERIIQNLLSNAIKFTNVGGEIRIRLGVNNASTLSLKVEDNGIGIEEEMLPRLFDRFFQVDDKTTRSHEGTGIGLALVKELTELMGGKVKVESTLGQGTSFSVKIPVVKLQVLDDKKASIKESTNSDQIPDTADGELLILVVEDNEELRNFIIESLAEKYAVLGSANGEEAWEIIQNEMPDLVISDVMMPIMSGYELCELAKTDIRTAHIDFIMLTAKSSQEAKEKGLAYRADEYLTKPFHVKELELRIANFIQRREAVQAHLIASVLPQEIGAKPQKVNNAFVKNLMEFLNNNIQSTDIDASTIAREMNMSKSTLNRKMNAILNISINKFIRNYRLQKSKEFLSAQYTVSETAFKVGFDSPSYFTQCFKEYYKKSPSEFQKEAV